MQQKTLIALAALGVIGIAAYLTMRAPDKGQRIGPPPRPITAFKGADVKELDLTSAGGKDHVVLKHDGTSWKVTSPGAWKADQQMAKTATDQLEKLGFGDLVTETPAKFAELEVSDDKGTHVIAKDVGGKVLLDGWLGKSVAGFTMLRPAGPKNEVWQATGLFKNTFARDVKTWRDHVIFEFTKDDVSKLTVEAPPQKVVLEKLPPATGEKPGATETKWKVAESSVKVDPLDDATVNNLINSLTNLRAAGFADDAKLEEVGLAPTAKLTLTAMVKGAAQTLLVGNTKGDDTWVQVVGKPQVYLVQKFTAERLVVTPPNFREKTLVKAKDADLVGIDITFGGETWSVKHEGATWKPVKGELDDNKVKALVSSFEKLEGSAFSTVTAPKETGLDKPTGAVTLRLRDKSVVTLKVGAVKDGSDYYVARVGSPDVMLVKKYAVDRFLKKSADFAKSATPPPGPANPHMAMPRPGKM